MLRFDLDYERSLALHAAVAEQLRRRPELLDQARRKLEEWLLAGGNSTPLWEKWQKVLQERPERIAAFLVERSEEAAWLRKASPFAGMLDAKERWRIIRETRARFGSNP